jgi:hypothetical protein
VNLDIEAIKGKKLFIATPMYNGNSTASYTVSTTDLAYNLGKIGIEFELHTLSNESLVQRARNKLVKEFLKSKSDMLMFIDSDIGFQWQDVLKMMEVMTLSNDKKVIAGIYPMKEIDWDKLKYGYFNNLINNKQDAINYSSYFVANFEEDKTFNLLEPISVSESGTGFMMIHRDVFDSFKRTYPKQFSIDPDDGTEMFYYFDCEIDPKTKHYLSEDYMFCRYVQSIGYKIWVLPWIELNHTGSFIFNGSFLEYSKMHYEQQRQGK